MYITKQVSVSEVWSHPSDYPKMVPLINQESLKKSEYWSVPDPGIPILTFADRLIRRCQVSCYNDLVEELPSRSDLNWAADMRYNFYKNQIQKEVNATIHQNTVLVTYDGINAAGKSGLIQTLEIYLERLDPGVFRGRQGKLGLKTSSLAEGLQPLLVYHENKVKQQDREEIISIDFLGHLFQFAFSLTKIAANKSPMNFLDRSYISSLAKGSCFIEKRNEDVLKKMGWIDQKDPERVKWAQEKLPYYQLEYLIDQMRDKYIVPDLSVVLLCGPSTASQRQIEREKKKKIKSKPIDHQEVQWYYFFRDRDVLPNALYIDTEKETPSEQVKKVALAIKESCEDKNTEIMAKLAERITPQSIDEFLVSSDFK